MNMNRFSTLIACFVFSALAPALAAASGVNLNLSKLEMPISNIIKTETIDQLDLVISKKSKDERKARACAFQTANGLPPTLCFHAELSKDERRRMAVSCVERARRTRTIPSVDEWTDSECRQSLEERRRDLEYSGT